MGTELGLNGRRRDGTEFPVDIALSPVDPGSDMVIIAAVRDMTNYRMAEEDHRRLDQLSAVVEFSGEAMMSSMLDGVITSWNPASERLYGYTSEEIIDKSIGLLNPNDRPGELEAILAKIKAGEHVENFQTMNIRKDGTVFPVSVTVSPIRDENGTVIGASKIAHDLTRQMEASELARSMIEASLDTLVTISTEGKITGVNEAMVNATGVPREKIISTAFSDYCTDPEKAEEIYQRTFSEGRAVDYPLTMRHRNGTLTEVLYNASVYRSSSGKVLGVFAAARDVTKQVQAQRELAHQQAQALERLAELERFQRLTVGRELKMIELKKEIEYLRNSRPDDGGEPDGQR